MLVEWLQQIKNLFEDHYRPTQIISPFGTHGCTYGNDDYEGEYVVIGFVVPDGCFAEIEDGTYGNLQGFRIYL